MGRRLQTDADPEGPIFQEMLEQEPPIFDGIKLSGTLMEQLVLVANEVGMEGPRLGELLGLPRDEDRVNGDYHLSDDEVVELHEMSEELLSRIESSLKIDGDIVEAATDIHPREYSSVEASEVVYLRVYHKFWMVRDLLDFAIEQDLDIYVG